MTTEKTMRERARAIASVFFRDGHRHAQLTDVLFQFGAHVEREGRAAQRKEDAEIARNTFVTHEEVGHSMTGEMNTGAWFMRKKIAAAIEGAEKKK